MNRPSWLRTFGPDKADNVNALVTVGTASSVTSIAIGGACVIHALNSHADQRVGISDTMDAANQPVEAVVSVFAVCGK